MLALWHIKMKKKPISKHKLDKEFKKYKEEHQLTNEETAYFVFTGEAKNMAYNQNKQPIKILRKTGKVVDVTKASDQLKSKGLSKIDTRYYLCYPKTLV